MRTDWASALLDWRRSRAAFMMAFAALFVAGVAPISIPLARATPPPVATKINIVLADIEEAKAVLSAADAFVEGASDADVSIRVRDPKVTDRHALALYMGRAAMAWRERDAARLAAMIARTQDRVNRLSTLAPARISLIRSAAHLDGGWPHTRGASIVFGPELPAADSDLDALFFHELWHVISRANPNLHDSVYGLLGFVPCTEVSRPASLEATRLSNPDAPVERHVTPYDGAHFLMPILQATLSRYDPRRPSFAAYVSVRYALVIRDLGGRCTLQAEFVDDDLAKQQIKALAGDNTDYLMHPEEMLADNFALLMTNPQAAPDRWQLDRLARLLQASSP